METGLAYKPLTKWLHEHGTSDFKEFELESEVESQESYIKKFN